MGMKKVIDKKYEIQRELKRGRSGAIYYGVDLLYSKPVVIKAIDPVLSNEPRQASLFQEEILNLARLSHHNIAQIYDLKHDHDGQIYVITEYVDGPDLERLWRACRRTKTLLPEHLSVYLVAEVCAALDFIHSRRNSETRASLYILHQELAPSHVMITVEGEIKLIDFGMRNLRSKWRAPQGETLAPRKLNYLAPELLQPDAAIDGRADIFALGVIMYEALTGQRLIAADDPEQIIEILRTGRFNLSRLTTDDLSPKLREILHRALAHDPEKRYPSANHMYMDLMHHLILTAPGKNFKGAMAELVQQVCSQEHDENETIIPDTLENAAKPKAKENAMPKLEETKTNKYQTTSTLAGFFENTWANQNDHNETLYGKVGITPKATNSSHARSNGFASLPTDLLVEADKELVADQAEKLAFLPGQSQPDEKMSAALDRQNLDVTTANAKTPLPAEESRSLLKTDAVAPVAAFYVRREVDAKLETQVRWVGTTTVVEGAPQMGKSTLLAKAYAFAKQNQLKACYLDFQLFDTRQFESLETLFYGLAKKLALSFKTSIKPDECWDASLGAKENLTYFVEEAILCKAEAPILIIFDEVDLIFKFPYRDDFFATIRGWHNRRAIEESWLNLNLISAHSTEPYLWLQNVNLPLLNIGQRIRLNDFTFAQVSELNANYGAPLKNDNEIQTLMQLVGGQPYLVQQALHTLKHNKLSLSQLQKVAVDEKGPFADHLRRRVLCLQEHKEIRNAVRQFLRWSRCDDESQFQRLEGAGLICGETRHFVRMRCKLYKEYLERHL